MLKNNEKPGVLGDRPSGTEDELKTSAADGGQG